MQIKIDYANLEHVASYCKAVDLVARERKYLATLEGFPLEGTRAFVSSIIAHNYSQYYAIAGNEVVGWCDVLPKEFEGMKHVGVLGMGLLPAYRGKGLGRQLMDQAIAHAVQNNGIEKIELDVFSSNEPAIRLYKNFGFEIEGKRIAARKLDGQTDDIVLMGRQV